MTRGNVGSLLVFDPAKINFSGSESGLKSAASDAVEGIVTERGPVTFISTLSTYACLHNPVPYGSLVCGDLLVVHLLKPYLPCADYLTKVVVLGKSSSELHVKDIMTAKGKLMTVTPQHSVVEVMELMINNNFRHVPVVCFFILDQCSEGL